MSKTHSKTNERGPTAALTVLGLVALAVGAGSIAACQAPLGELPEQLGAAGPALSTKSPVSMTFVEVEGKATFSDATRFRPLDDLDVEASDVNKLSLDERAKRLQGVAVTRDGRLLEQEVDEDDMRILIRALFANVSVSEGGSTGLGETSVTGIEVDAFSDESVIGTDSRTQITDTTAWPFRTMGRVDIGCTGTLIGPRHVLTAGHCVYDIYDNVWYSDLDFSPGQDGSYYPFGRIGWEMAVSVSGWTVDEDRNFDYAMIVLDEDIGYTTGWMGYGFDNNLPTYTININGYPGDKPNGTMWHSGCQITSMSAYRLYYPCDTFGGMSGSGVYAYWSSTDERIIYGIHAYGVDSTGQNGATRINSTVFNNLYSWKHSF